MIWGAGGGLGLKLSNYWIPGNASLQLAVGTGILRHSTTELSDAGGPVGQHWQLTWPARVRSSDIVRPFHDSSSKRAKATRPTKVQESTRRYRWLRRSGGRGRTARQKRGGSSPRCLDEGQLQRKQISRQMREAEWPMRRILSRVFSYA